MEDQREPLSIQNISEKLKVPKPTLRFWEKELDGILVPLRTQGGQRRYTVDNISTIQQIKRLRRHGMSLAEIKRKLSDSNNAKAGNSNSNQLDLLAERVAEVEESEIYRFFLNSVDYTVHNDNPVGGNGGATARQDLTPPPGSEREREGRFGVKTG